MGRRLEELFRYASLATKKIDMDSIDAILLYLEEGKKTPPYKKLYDRIDSLEDKDYLNYHKTIKEFVRPQLVRSNFVPSTDKGSNSVNVTFVE